MEKSFTPHVIPGKKSHIKQVATTDSYFKDLRGQSELMLHTPRLS